jgi:hypothetical protein
MDPGAVEIRSRPPQQRLEDLLGAPEVAGEVLALGQLQVKRERLLVPRAPRVRREEGRRHIEEAPRRSVGGRCPGPPPRHRVEAAERLPLRSVGDEVDPAVQLAHDLEHPLLRFAL